MKLFKEVIIKNSKMILFYSILGIISTFINLYFINYFQIILNSFQSGNLTIKMIIFYGLIIIISSLLGYLINYPEQKFKNGLYLDFKLQSLKKMKTINYESYQKLGTGRLIQKVEEGSLAAREIVFQFWLRLINELLPTAIFSLIFIYLIEKRILLFILLGYVAVIVVTSLVLNKLYKLKEKILVNQELLNKHLVRGFMELVVFRTNKKYDTEINLSQGEIKNIVDEKTKIKLVHELFFTVFEILVAILKILILIYALTTKNLTVGAIVTIITLIGKAYEPIAIFNVEYVDYKLNKVSLKRYLEFLNLPDDEALEKGKIKKINGNIEIKDLDFSYGKKNVIKDLNLKIKEGETVAFVGESGSGKSTIIKLIMGLNKYDKGEVLIDNYDLKDLNLNYYYDYVSYLSQETPIFDGTLRENIIFDKKVSDEEIIKVLKIVHLDEFYSKLEKGLDTELGEKGILMSGGERQRVALARLFFDNSKIIILDEATSSLDNITERLIMKNIMKILNDRTILIIAHRLNSIKTVNKIFVLKQGKIIGIDNYNTLLKENKI